MVSNKTWLVALREYAENLRTKTFWIGILSFPVILAVAVVVPHLLSKAKDVRRYAVRVEGDDVLLSVGEGEDQ